MHTTSTILRGLAVLLLPALLLPGCDGSPSEPLGGMNVLLEGTLEAHLEVPEGQEEEVVVVEPVEHRVSLQEEGLVKVELVLWQGTDGETGVTQDFADLVGVGFNFGRVLPDDSCDSGGSIGLTRNNPFAFRLAAAEYCFQVFALSSGGPIFSDGDVATYQISLTDTQ